MRDAEVFCKKAAVYHSPEADGLFVRVQIQTGGYLLRWDENLSISDAELYRMGKRIPMNMDYFCAFASERIINAAEAAEILSCTRQHINELVKNRQAASHQDFREEHAVFEG